MEESSPVSAERVEDGDAALLARQAEEFLLSHTWCGSVSSSTLEYAIPGVLGVFRVTLVPTKPSVDSTLWVIVGDLPPAYLVCDGAPNWRAALRGYILEMNRWIAAVLSGISLDGIIPVRAAPTIEHANMLAARLEFLTEHCLHDGGSCDA